jgi:hypothetical protein
MASKFSHRFRFAAWALPVVCLSASAQEPGAQQADKHAIPITSVDQGDALPSGQDQPTDPIWGGEPNRHEFAILDDNVPAPDEAVVEVRPDGDRIIVPAGGDPNFLGFAAGRYYPPAGERIDPALNRVLRPQYDDGRPESKTYAFVMFQKRITPERIAAIEATGARVLGFHPHHTLKVALGVEQIDAIAYSDFVRWVGLPQTWQKVHPAMARTIGTLPAGDLFEAWVSVYDSDLNPASVERKVGVVEAGGPEGVVTIDAQEQLPSEFDSFGWQHRELERAGLTILNFDPDILAFRVRMLPGSLPMVAELDFVQFVEPRGIPTLAHDESMAMVNADYTRTSYDGNTNMVAIAGQADSGLEYDHDGLSGFTWWSTNLTGSGESSVDDICGHGSHVAGTIHGNASVEDSYEGAVNALGWGATGRYFNTKIFYGAGCNWGGTTVSAILGAMDGAVTDGNGDVTPRPHVINHSWGTNIWGSIGSEADCRTIDTNVYTKQQLQVWAAGNSGSGASTIWEEGSSKNALTVGNVRDYINGAEMPGTISPGSSRGPCGDGRWKPNVVAPGTNILSIDSATAAGYTNKSGTSMASPHVTGVASQLVDHVPFLRYNPATLSALLMGTAMTKDNVALSTPTDSHLDVYGAGRIEAYKAHFGTSQQALYYWGYTQGSSGFSDVDFTVSPGATRVVAVLHYVEAASSAGASQALVNDFDMYLDQPPLTAPGNSGDWVAQQSALNNTEIRIIDNPVTGAWKLKVWPESVTSTAYIGLTVSVIYGDLTPNPTLAVTANDSFVQPNQNVVISADLTNPAYIASGVALVSSATGEQLINATGVLADGSSANYMNNTLDGEAITVGNLRHSQTRGVDWTVRWATEGVKPFNVQSESENALDKSVTVNITVDGTPPPAIAGLTCFSHQVNVVSCEDNVSLGWHQASDPLSGVLGLSYLWNQTSNSIPDTITDLGATVNSLGVVMVGSGGWYFHIRVIDKSGNASTTAHLGPFLFDSTPVSTYCTALTSSSGCVATMGSSGTPSLANPGGFSINTGNMEASKPGLLFFGTTGKASSPFFGGTLCVGAPVYRLNVKFSGGAAACSGAISYTLSDFLTSPGAAFVVAGATVDCQVWYRDPAAAQAVGLSGGLEFLVCP